MNIVTANKLYELRKKNGLSQEELADKIGVSRQAISKWERAESSPDTDNLIALADLYGITLDELLNKKEAVESNIIEENKKNQEDIVEVVEEKDEDDEDDEDNDDINEDSEDKLLKKSIAVRIVDSCIFIVAAIAFLLLGLLIEDAFRWSWLTFLLAIVISSLVHAIKLKRAEVFNYPVFVTMIYLFLGLGYPGAIWHPTWVIFITIPIFYSITGIFKKSNKNDCCDKEND